MTIAAARTVFAKELVDSLRDRRSVLGALLMPLFGPLMFALMVNFAAEQHDEDKPVSLPVVGAELAPSLIAFLEEHEIEIAPPPEDPDAAVRAGDAEAVLVIDERFAGDFRAARPARVELVFDASNDEGRVARRRTLGLLEAYSRQIGNLRLLARGVAPDVATALRIERVDLATPKRRAAQLLGMLPMFTLLVAFIGGMNVAIDTTAGERERRSLEPLLINPASRLGLVIGKWGVTVLFNLAATALTLLIFYVVLARLPLDRLGISIDFGGPQILQILLLAAPVALFSAAVLMLVSIFAKSFKEAQTYLSLMVFVPMVPSMMLMMNPMKPTLWAMCLPTFGQNLLVNELMRGEPLVASHVVVAAAASLLLTLFGVVLAARLFQRERIIFGR